MSFLKPFIGCKGTNKSLTTPVSDDFNTASNPLGTSTDSSLPSVEQIKTDPSIEHPSADQSFRSGIESQNNTACPSVLPRDYPTNFTHGNVTQYPQSVSSSVYWEVLRKHDSNNFSSSTKSTRICCVQ